MRACESVDFFLLVGTIHMGHLPHVNKSTFLREIHMSWVWYNILCRPSQNPLELPPPKSLLLLLVRSKLFSIHGMVLGPLSMEAAFLYGITPPTSVSI